MKKLYRVVERAFIKWLQWRLLWITPPVHGQGKFLQGKGCSVTNTHINTRNGDVILGDYVCIAQGCMLVTGKHDLKLTGVGVRPLANERRDIIIKDGVWISIGCIILGGVTIGENSVIGAGSVVAKDIPPNSFVTSNPLTLTGIK